MRFSTTCRYELSPDSHFIAAPHPEHPSVWLLGGGSGHGFKHGPAMAERMAAALSGNAPMPQRFRLGERAVGQSMRTSGSGR
jgi:sarcosine oxidase